MFQDCGGRALFWGPRSSTHVVSFITDRPVPPDKTHEASTKKISYPDPRPVLILRVISWGSSLCLGFVGLFSVVEDSAQSGLFERRQSRQTHPAFERPIAGDWFRDIALRKPRRLACWAVRCLHPFLNPHQHSRYAAAYATAMNLSSSTSEAVTVSHMLVAPLRGGSWSKQG